jgi:hypothetical protein
MRIILLFILLFICSVTSAQKNRFSIDLVYRPEITNYKDSISFRWREKTPRHTLSPSGFRVLPEYHLTDQFFIRTGIGFINRAFKNNAFFNHAILGDSLQWLLLSKKTEYRIIEFPVNLGYSLFVQKDLAFSIIGEMAFNYLVNAHYNPNVHTGTYQKGYWMGKSFSGLFSAQYKIKTNLKLSFEAGYSLKNDSKKDIFLFSQDEPVIAIEHTYTPILVGLNYTFR